MTDPKAVYPVWLSEDEVKQVFRMRDFYGFGQSILDKIESAAQAKSEDDPIKQRFAEYAKADRENEAFLRTKKPTRKKPDIIMGSDGRDYNG